MSTVLYDSKRFLGRSGVHPHKNGCDRCPHNRPRETHGRSLCAIGWHGATSTSRMRSMSHNSLSPVENGNLGGKVRGQHTMMTETGKASDQTLTEEAYAPGISWGANLRERLAAGDTGAPNPAHDDDNPNYDAWGDYLVGRYACLRQKFEDDPSFSKPRTFDELWVRQRKDEQFRVEWNEYTALKHVTREPSKAKNGRPKGAWELTLTYSPKWYQDDTEAQEAFRTAERRLLKYYADEFVLYRSVGEFTRDGRAHLHILYRLGNGGKFTDKNLRRAYPHWNAKVKVGKGNQGGHHAPVANLADYSGYIEKELSAAWHNFDIANADDPTRTETA